MVAALIFQIWQQMLPAKGLDKFSLEKELNLGFNFGMEKYILGLLLFFGSFYCFSAIPTLSSNQKRDWLQGPGSLHGGNSNGYMSILDIKSQSSSKLKTQRLVLDWGDRILRPAIEGGYYQLEYKSNPPMIVLNLGLTLNTKIENSVLMKRISKGLFVKETKIDFDPISQSMDIVFYLRQPTQVKAQQKQGPPAQLVIDLIGL